MLDKAIKFATDLKRNKYRLCAIITDKRGRILSIGTNSYKKSHPRQAYYAVKCGNKDAIFLHAEIDALVKVKYTDTPYAIYIARVNNQGQSRLAKPCNICLNAIKDAGIEKVYYTK